MAAERLLEGQAEALTQAAVSLALDGDVTALRLCLDRLLPPRKERPLSLKLPVLDTAAGVSKALERIVQAVASGELLPGEGQALAAVLEQHRKGIETAELGTRVEALEGRVKGQNYEPETAD